MVDLCKRQWLAIETSSGRSVVAELLPDGTLRWEEVASSSGSDALGAGRPLISAQCGHRCMKLKDLHSQLKVASCAADSAGVSAEDARRRFAEDAFALASGQARVEPPDAMGEACKSTAAAVPQHPGLTMNEDGFVIKEDRSVRSDWDSFYIQGDQVGVGFWGEVFAVREKEGSAQPGSASSATVPKVMKVMPYQYNPPDGINNRTDFRNMVVEEAKALMRLPRESPYLTGFYGTFEGLFGPSQTPEYRMFMRMVTNPTFRVGGVAGEAQSDKFIAEVNSKALFAGKDDAFKWLFVWKQMMKTGVQGMADMHEAGMLHRDLTTENIMFTGEFPNNLTTVLVDYGQAVLGEVSEAAKASGAIGHGDVTWDHHIKKGAAVLASPEHHLELILPGQGADDRRRLDFWLWGVAATSFLFRWAEAFHGKKLVKRFDSRMFKAMSFQHRRSQYKSSEFARIRPSLEYEPEEGVSYSWDEANRSFGDKFKTAFFDTKLKSPEGVGFLDEDALQEYAEDLREAGEFLARFFNHPDNEDPCRTPFGSHERGAATSTRSLLNDPVFWPDATGPVEFRRVPESMSLVRSKNGLVQKEEFAHFHKGTDEVVRCRFEPSKRFPVPVEVDMSQAEGVAVPAMCFQARTTNRSVA